MDTLDIVEKEQKVDIVNTLEREDKYLNMASEFGLRWCFWLVSYSFHRLNFPIYPYYSQC